MIAGALAGQTGPCDRACLEGFVDQYMDALIAHDVKKLPMTARVKNTEDGVRLDPGDGFWRTALAKGSYRLARERYRNRAGRVSRHYAGSEYSHAKSGDHRRAVENRKPAGFRDREYSGPATTRRRRTLEKIGSPNRCSWRRSRRRREFRAGSDLASATLLVGTEKNDGKKHSFAMTANAFPERRPDRRTIRRCGADDSASDAGPGRQAAAAGATQTTRSANQHYFAGMRGSVQAGLLPFRKSRARPAFRGRGSRARPGDGHR